MPTPLEKLQQFVFEEFGPPRYEQLAPSSREPSGPASSVRETAFLLCGGSPD